MNDKPYETPQSSPEVNSVSNTPSIIVAVLIWVIWIILLLGEVVLLRYAYSPDPSSKKWVLSFEWLIALVILVAISLSIRFLLIPKIKKLWILFPSFLIGIFFANTISLTGMFAVLQGQQTHILVGVILILLYCPYWINVPKKLNKTKNFN